MRILLSCLQDLRQHAIPAYRFWATYFRNGIVEAGHEFAEVPNVDWAEGCAAKSNDELKVWRETIWTRTLDWIRTELGADRRLDLFLSYFFPQQIEPSAIAEIKKLGIPCVNFFCDNVREFSSVPSEFKCFDLNWVPEYEAIPMYKVAKVPYLKAPMPCWVAPVLRTLPERETESPTFIGSADDLRKQLFSDALNLGAELVVRGPGWSGGSAKHVSPKLRSATSVLRNQLRFARKHGIKSLGYKLQNKVFSTEVIIPAAVIKPPVWGDEYFKVSREARITLGVNRVSTVRTGNRRPLVYSRLRDIEAPMLGACYLTEFTAGLAHLYDLGEEIETYQTAEELAHKIDMLKRDSVRRRRMRGRAQQRALNDHSMAKTLRRILKRLDMELK
jgi:hypothetical protein